MGQVKEFLLEVLKMLVPLALAYIGLLKNRTDLDIIAAKQRTPDGERDYTPYMRRRWYHKLKPGRKSDVREPTRKAGDETSN